MFPSTRNNQNFKLNTNKKLEFDTEAQVLFSFLAAMSSSRSDDVTKSVCPSAVIFFLLVFLVFYVVLKGFNDVSRKG